MGGAKGGRAGYTLTILTSLKFVLTTSEVKEFPFTEAVKTAAKEFITKGRESLLKLDKEATKEHRPEAMKQLAAALKDLSSLGDKLVEQAEGSIRGAATAVLQAQLEHEGSLPLDAGRLEQFRGLVGAEELELLQSVASLGVPLLQGEDPSGQMPYEGPYASATPRACSLCSFYLKI
jgi:hypothetical protein